MKIHIEDQIYLESDERNFVLKKYLGTINKQTGKEQFIPIGYFGSVQSAMNFMLRRKIGESKATTFKELKQDIDRIEEWLKNKIGY